MGLGKTLQSITILWTLMTQGFDGKPAVTHTIVACPVSLVTNWESELKKKWIGLDRAPPPRARASKAEPRCAPAAARPGCAAPSRCARAAARRLLPWLRAHPPRARLLAHPSCSQASRRAAST